MLLPGEPAQPEYVTCPSVNLKMSPTENKNLGYISHFKILSSHSRVGVAQTNDEIEALQCPQSRIQNKTDGNQLKIKARNLPSNLSVLQPVVFLLG